MSSAAQIQANHANSLASTGPRTETGKAASALNNLQHGARSEAVLLPGEDPAAYNALLADLTAHFGSGHSPDAENDETADLTELRLIREMADADWRLLRIRRCSADALSRRIAELATDFPDSSAIQLQTRAIETLASSTGTSYDTWLRYESKFERQHDRAYKAWMHYQTSRRRVADKEADIWMRSVIFRPTPGQTPTTNLADGRHPAIHKRELNELASSVQNAEAPEAALASNVQNAASTAPTAATRAAGVRDSDEAPSSVQIARNSPCPCGSGDKFKRCCGKNAPPLLGKAA